MQRMRPLVSIIFLTAFAISCTRVQQKNWTSAVPEDTPFIFISEAGIQLREISENEIIPFIDDITAGSIQLISLIANRDSSPVSVKAFMLYPATATTWQPVWITETSADYLSTLSDRYYKPFTDNNYLFHDIVIHKLHLQDEIIFGAQVGGWLLLSQSSYGLEQSLRSYLGIIPALEFPAGAIPGTFITNTPKLDQWVEQLATTLYRPSIKNAFTGLEPAATTFAASEDTSRKGMQFNASFRFSGDAPAALTRAFSSLNSSVSLDRYIPSNTAGFAILRMSPPMLPSAETMDTALDSLLSNDNNQFRELATYIDPAFAFVSFAESGISNSGEYMYLRKLTNRNAFQALINNLAEQGLIAKSGQSYFVSSSIMGSLIGSELSDFRDFYLSFSGNVAAISKRKGLAESVDSDRARRRVIFYDDTYAEIRSELPEEVSAFVWIASKEFQKFIVPYLDPQNYLSAIFSRFDLATLTFKTTNQQVDAQLNTYQRELEDAPFEELWVFPLGNTDLSGTTVLADITGSSREELIFATTSGTVYGLASDGTQVFQVSTEREQPIGSPIVYDWYGNGMEVILLAAGNKLYGWNRAGNLLPKFPFELPARISAPVTVTDVLRNGVPEVIIPTEDRSLHILDGRGLNIEGWPQRTNTVINYQPRYNRMSNIWAVWATAENGLHSWLRDGTIRAGFPKFGNAPFTAPPVFYKNSILTSSADGYVYAFNNQPLFSDTLSTSIPDDSLAIQSLYIADSEIYKLTPVPNVLLRDSTGFYREDILLSYSINGSVFMNNTRGGLEFTQSMGQPASRAFAPILTDINADREREVIALGSFGRLYVWEVLTGERLFDLPTSGMQYPLITDLNNDGNMELIAQTREGVRCWTIRKEN